jgi:hypothetical protein
MNLCKTLPLLFLIVVVGCVGEEKDKSRQANSLKVEYDTTIAFVGEKLNISPSDSNINFCTPGRDYYQVVYNKDSESYLLAFYNRVNHSVNFSTIDRNYNQKNKEVPLNDSITDVSSLLLLNEDSVLLTANSHQSVVICSRTGETRTVSQEKIFGSDSLYLLHLRYPSFIKKDSLLIGFGGMFNSPNKKHRFDFSFLAYLDLKTLRAKKLPFRLPKGLLNKKGSMGSDFTNLSIINGKPYFNNTLVDTTLLAVSEEDHNLYKKDVPEYLPNREQILSNDSIFEGLFKRHYHEMKLRNHVSPVYEIGGREDKIDVKFKPLSVKRAGQRIKVKYDSTIVDVYDNSLSFTKRIKIPYVSTNFWYTNNRLLFRNREKDSKKGLFDKDVIARYEVYRVSN